MSTPAPAPRASTSAPAPTYSRVLPVEDRRSAGVVRRRLHDCRRRRASRRTVSTLTSARAVRTAALPSTVGPGSGTGARGVLVTRFAGYPLSERGGAALALRDRSGWIGPRLGAPPDRLERDLVLLAAGGARVDEDPVLGTGGVHAQVSATITTRAVLIPTCRISDQYRVLANPACQRPDAPEPPRSGSRTNALQRGVARVECERPLIEPPCLSPVPHPHRQVAEQCPGHEVARDAARSLAQGRNGGRPFIEARQRRRLHVVRVELVGCDPQRTVSLGERSGGVVGQRGLGLRQIVLAQSLAGEQDAREHECERGGGNERDATRPSRGPCGFSSRLAGGTREDRACSQRHRGDTWDQVEPVNARMHQPRRRRAYCRHRQCPPEHAAPGGARGAPGTPAEPGDQDCEQDRAEQAELRERLQLDRMRLTDVLRRRSPLEVRVAVVAGSHSGDGVLAERRPRDAPVVVPVPRPCNEPGGGAGRLLRRLSSRGGRTRRTAR